MTKRGPTEGTAHRLKNAIERALSSKGKSNVSVVGRSNVVVSRNVGSPNSQHDASASQSTRIVQTNGEIHTDTSTVDSSEGGDTES